MLDAKSAIKKGRLNVSENKKYALQLELLTFYRAFDMKVSGFGCYCSGFTVVTPKHSQDNIHYFYCGNIRSEISLRQENRMQDVLYKNSL